MEPIVSPVGEQIVHRPPSLPDNLATIAANTDRIATALESLVVMIKEARDEVNT